ncbi:MAG: response regulator [Terriglobales bacterium]
MARKILLADDSVTAQNMGRRILSDAGYEVITVNNGSAALKRIAESKPDLIVLDVYMPGYGGLEVCQRLRESRETARIPVLLTVGKLEPFKPEEARRVRADAFIVKPFEASELLTALTKLEDRIVPQPAPYKPGRFAQAMSAIESEATSNAYGDLDSGWKNRLKMPVPQSHGPDLEIEEQAEARKPDTYREQQPAAPVIVPRDITPEEIAAINAAAAAFETPIAEPAAAQQAATSVAPVAFVSEPAGKGEEARPEMMADEDEKTATFATAASALETQPEPDYAGAERRSEFPVVAEGVKADAAERDGNAAADTQPALPAPPQEVASDTAPVPKAEEQDDFAAALASLAPSNGEGTPTIQQFTGPRWIAELTAVTDAESALILEQEMQKAVAAMADMCTQPITAVEAPITSVEEAHQEAIEAPGNHAIASSQKVEAETPTSLVAAMAEVPSLSDVVDSVLPRPSAQAATLEPQGAAFAAAAAVGGDAASPSVTPSEVPQVAASHGDTVEHQRESELAAAWESWKHIRESVVESQFTSQVADAAAEAQNPPQAEQSSQPETEDETGAQEEAGAIASIVDSVLADLKPRLMEEISRKMGKEKKRK